MKVDLHRRHPCLEHTGPAASAAVTFILSHQRTSAAPASVVLPFPCPDAMEPCHHPSAVESLVVGQLVLEQALAPAVVLVADLAERAARGQSLAIEKVLDHSYLNQFCN